MDRIFFPVTDPASAQTYTLSLHDALPIYSAGHRQMQTHADRAMIGPDLRTHLARLRAQLARDQYVIDPHRERPEVGNPARSEEHTSELQSQSNLVCRLLLEKKKAASPSQT